MTDGYANVQTFILGLIRLASISNPDYPRGFLSEFGEGVAFYYHQLALDFCWRDRRKVFCEFRA